MVAFSLSKLWPISILLGFLGLQGCTTSTGESLRVLNSTGADLDNLEIAFLDSEKEIELDKTKVADLQDDKFRFRFGYCSDGNDPRYSPIYEIPEKVLLEWTEDGVYSSRLIEIPEDIRDYYNKNRNRKDALHKYLTFEINPDRTISTYLYMWENAGSEDIYFPER